MLNAGLVVGSYVFIWLKNILLFFLSWMFWVLAANIFYFGAVELWWKGLDAENSVIFWLNGYGGAGCGVYILFSNTDIAGLLYVKFGTNPVVFWILILAVYYFVWVSVIFCWLLFSLAGFLSSFGGTLNNSLFYD